MLTKRQARYVWYCINEHSGLLSESAEDWCEECGISLDEFEAFCSLVEDAIESIKAQP